MRKPNADKAILSNLLKSLIFVTVSKVYRTFFLRLLEQIYTFKTVTNVNDLSNFDRIALSAFGFLTVY